MTSNLEIHQADRQLSDNQDLHEVTASYKTAVDVVMNESMELWPLGSAIRILTSAIRELATAQRKENEDGRAHRQHRNDYHSEGE